MVVVVVEVVVVMERQKGEISIFGLIQLNEITKYLFSIEAEKEILMINWIFFKIKTDNLIDKLKNNQLNMK